MYETREAAAAACTMEAAAAKHYSKLAITFAAQGECNKAWKMADTAKVAAKCAMQAHEALWEISSGELTEAEFEAFEAAEIAQGDARKATKAAGDAVAKLNSEAQSICSTNNH